MMEADVASGLLNYTTTLLIFISSEQQTPILEII